MKHCPLHHLTYVPAKIDVATANCEGDALPRKNIFDLDPKVKGFKVPQSVAQYPRLHVTYVPAKFDVDTSRSIYKKIHYLSSTLGSRPHEILPSTLHIM